MNENETLTTEEVVENTPEQTNEPEVNEVPVELRGLSKDIQEEAMKELADENTPKEEPAQETQGEEVADTAETDSDNKRDEPAFKKPNQKVPYARFKEMVDKNNDMKAELEALKNRMAQMETKPPQQPAPQAQPNPRRSFSVTPDMARQIDEAINQQAIAMAGLTKEDLDSMEYMDETDPRKMRYAHAKEMAKAEVYYNIQQARVQQQQEYQRLVARQNQAVDSFNNFYYQQLAEPDFNEVREYATADFFNSLAPDEQPVVREAYERVERNTASPQDIAVVKRFFLDAKSSYRQKAEAASKAAQAKSAANNIESKYQKQKAFPRASQVNGTSANTGTPSAEALERMLNELPWDEIPDEYKQLVMNSSIY